MQKLLVLVLALAAGFAPAAALAQAAPDTLGRIKAAKAINVAYSDVSLPFSFDGTDKQPAGYSIDLCKRVIAQIARATGVPDLKVNWLRGSVNERLDMVASGRADLECANTTQTQARLARVDFSGLTFVDAGGFLVVRGGPIQGISDFAGKRIAVRKGTTTEQRLNETLKARLINATVVTVDDPRDGVALLESGGADGMAGDKIALIGLAVQAKDSAKIAMLAEEFSFEPYAMALPRGDSAFRLVVNRALTQVYTGGEIDSIYATWFAKLGRPSPLLAVMFLLNSIPE
jgi:ABC-type amino acid transport substrate-binding protein